MSFLTQLQEHKKHVILIPVLYVVYKVLRKFTQDPLEGFDNRLKSTHTWLIFTLIFKVLHVGNCLDTSLSLTRRLYTELI